MKGFAAYIRVSTFKQAEKGASLIEQRDAASRFAATHRITISDWLEEHVTASKAGRPVFARLLQHLRSGKYAGVIMHKVDRSSRNPYDWADLRALADTGVPVHFAAENIDLNTNGGRFTGDILAVLANHYSRNLRDEVLKGLRGRLKQGLYPFRAPFGYLDRGSGRIKDVDPERAPVVTRVFERYAAGGETIDSLTQRLRSEGVRNRSGGSINRNVVARILTNPFYAGLIKIIETGEVYTGKHRALISVNLFKAVQERLAGRFRSRGWRHEFLLRGLFRCALCGRVLSGEKQKGHRYYRCHTRGCPTKTFREEVLEEAMLNSWFPIASTTQDLDRLKDRLEFAMKKEATTSEHKQAQLRLRAAAVSSRIERLIDAYVDRVLDKASFDARKLSLLEEQRSVQEMIEDCESDMGRPRSRLSALIDLASDARSTYRRGAIEQKRQLALLLCASREVAGTEVKVTSCLPMQILQARTTPNGGKHTTKEEAELSVARRLVTWALGSDEADLSAA